MNTPSTPAVRADLAPEMRRHLHYLHILAGNFRARGITAHPRYPQLTLAVIEDEIAAITGHAHEAQGGAYCIHCGWPFVARGGQP